MLRPAASLLAAALLACSSSPPGAERPPGGEDPPGVDTGPGDVSDPPLVGPAPYPFSAPPRGEWPPLQRDLPRFDLQIAPADLALLNERIDDLDLLVPGRFSASGQTYDVQVRYRGRSTRYRPKKPFQVRFGDQAFEGRRRLELLAEWRDGGVITEKLWYDLAHAAGLRVPRARFVNLYLNDSFYGVMTEVERVDKPFLAAHAFDDLDGNVYRCGWKDCELRDRPGQPWQEPWEKHTNESEPWDDLNELLRIVNRTPPAELAAALERTIDLDAYLTWLAVDAVIANATQGDSSSYLVHDRVSGKWTYVPWDLNNARSIYDRTLGVAQAPRADRRPFAFSAYDSTAYALADFNRDNGLPDATPLWSVLNTRIYDDPALRSRFLAKLRGLLDGVFREDVIGPRADAAEALLAPHLARDRFVDQAYPPRSAEFLRQFVRERREYLLAQLDRISRLGGESQLRIRRVGLGPGGSPVLELCNPGASTIVAEGFVTGDVRDRRQTTLGARTIAPGTTIALSLSWPGLATSLSGPFPEVAVFARDGQTVLDVLWLPPPSRSEGLTRPAPCAEPAAFGPLN